MPLPSDSDRADAARNALLQLNVMVAQGLQPDVPMYTSLITIMGRAGLEWQAFKLFSRMLEQGLQPLPETYLALRRATSPSRQKLISDLEVKMREAALALPEELAGKELQSQTEAKEDAVRRFKRLMRGEAVVPIEVARTAPSLQEHRAAAAARADAASAASSSAAGNSTSAADGAKPRGDAGAGGSGNIPVMSIHSVEGVVHTMHHIQQREAFRAGLAKPGAERAALERDLNRLHEEELRILLTHHRQFRDGDKAALVARVLDNLQARSLRALFDRRRKYFDSVRLVLEDQIDQLRAAAAATGTTLEALDGDMALRARALDAAERGVPLTAIPADVRTDASLTALAPDQVAAAYLSGADAMPMQLGDGNGPAAPSLDSDDIDALAAASLDGAMDTSIQGTMHDGEAASTGPPLTRVMAPSELPSLREQGQAPLTGSAAENVGTSQQLSAREAWALSPPLLQTPWGDTIRRPLRPPPAPHVRNPARDARAALDAGEMKELTTAVFASAIDQLPVTLLRRYARQFRLKWSRHQDNGTQLMNLIDWHVRRLNPNGAASDLATDTGMTQAQLQEQRVALYRQEELAAARKTVDRFNLVVAAAKRCDNMTLVDSAAVSKEILRHQLRERAVERGGADAQRAQAHASTVETLQQQLRAFPYKVDAAGVAHPDPTRFNEGAFGSEAADPTTPHPESAAEGFIPRESSTSSILGLPKPASSVRTTVIDKDSGADTTSGGAAAADAGSAERNELPPWVITTAASDTPFNVAEGRFQHNWGAQYQEDPSGRIVARPRRDAERHFTVDPTLLGGRDAARYRETELRDEAAARYDRDVTQARLDRKQRSGKYSRFRAFVDRASEERAAAKERAIASGADVRPLRRMEPLAKRLHATHDVDRDAASVVRRRGQE
jgi:hypothetical protein